MRSRCIVMNSPFHITYYSTKPGIVPARSPIGNSFRFFFPIGLKTHHLVSMDTWGFYYLIKFTFSSYFSTINWLHLYKTFLSKYRFTLIKFTVDKLSHSWSKLSRFPNRIYNAIKVSWLRTQLDNRPGFYPLNKFVWRSTAERENLKFQLGN